MSHLMMNTTMNMNHHSDNHNEEDNHLCNAAVAVVQLPMLKSNKKSVDKKVVVVAVCERAQEAVDAGNRLADNQTMKRENASNRIDAKNAKNWWHQRMQMTTNQVRQPAE